jgi:cation diffusion facilitator CzcD-associated flavoprotein CzcO
MPHRDRPITDFERRLYRRVPALQRLIRAGVYFSRELVVPGLVNDIRLMKALQRIAVRHMENQVPDPELRARLSPSYVLGCKRILPSNEWYPALQQPNVEVVTDGIREVVPQGIVTSDGKLHDVDTIVFATGFYVTDIPFAHRIRRADGVSMADSWNGSAQAYLGTAVPGFPNFFFVTGPNTGLGHNSLLFMIEAQLTYLIGALRAMKERGATRVEVRPEVVETYNARIQKRLVNAVWTKGGCSSWYLDENGKNTTIWPYFTWRFWLATRRFDPASYSLTNGRPAPGRAALNGDATAGAPSGVPTESA